jgi:hypothetical protein
MNLLPQSQKEAIKKDVFSRFLLVVEGISALLGLIFLVLIYNVTLYINIQTPIFEERLQQERLTETSQIYEMVKEEINELNSTLVKIQKVNDISKFNFPEILRNIGKYAPQGVRFNTMSFSGEALLIVGHADTRDQALVFKQNLEKNSICGSLASPVIVRELDVTFTFNCKLR